MSAVAWQALPLPGGELSMIDGWLDPDEADVLLAQLIETIPWENHRIRMFGREVASPRLSCWIGDAAYTYSGTRFEPHPWPEALSSVRERLERELGAGLNSVLANLYRDGQDRLGFHRDSEPELGPEPLIASISLGATRRFRLREREGRGSYGIDLEHGSLLVMAGATQRNWLHAVPPTARLVGPRINLTFRRVLR